MRKVLELTDPRSCLNKADPDELLFVLLARDAAAPATVEEWIRKRILYCLDEPNSPKLVEARQWVAEVRAEFAARLKPGHIHATRDNHQLVTFTGDFEGGRAVCTDVFGYKFLAWPETLLPPS